MTPFGLLLRPQLNSGTLGGRERETKLDPMKNLVLNFRFGGHKGAPERADLERALDEIFRESALGLTEGDLAEHPSSWLTFGQQIEDRWTIVSVDIYRSGLAILSKHADQDDADPEYEYRCNAVDEAKALQLWDLLTRGAESELVARFRDES